MNPLFKITTLLLIAGMLTILVPVKTQAQEVGNVELIIHTQPVLFLYYYDTLDVTITSAQLAALIGASTNNPEGTATLNAWSDDAAIAPAAVTGNLSSQDIEIQNAWAVRAVGHAGRQVEVSVATTANTTLEHQGGAATGGTIEVNSVAAGIGATPTYAGTVAFNSQGPQTPQVGHLQINIDLSAMKQAGQFAEAGGNHQFTITAQHQP